MLFDRLTEEQNSESTPLFLQVMEEIWGTAAERQTASEPPQAATPTIAI